MAKYYIKKPCTRLSRMTDYTEHLSDYDHLSTSWGPVTDGYPKLLTLEQVIEVIKLMAKSPGLYPVYTIELADD